MTAAELRQVVVVAHARCASTPSVCVVAGSPLPTFMTSSTHTIAMATAGRILLAMREKGAIVSREVAQHVLRIVIEGQAPQLLQQYKISLSFVSN